MTLRMAVSLAISASILMTSMEATAQAPTSHWSTFNKPASACACHVFAKQAFQREKMKILEDTGSVLLGGNNQVTAEIICLPGGKQVRVSAFSADSTAAERARNNLRAHIVKAQIIDTCP